MNAILANAAPTPQTADRADRLLAMLQRLAEIGMQLAERAAEQALAEPPPQPESAPKAKRRGPDPRYVFIRLSRFVHDTIALEARLAAGKPPRSVRTASQAHAAPQATGKVVNNVAETAPNPPSVKVGLRQHLDAFVTPDPRNRPGHVDVATLGHKLDLARNAAKIQANILNQPPHLVRELERIAAQALAAHHVR